MGVANPAWCHFSMESSLPFHGSIGIDQDRTDAVPWDGRDARGGLVGAGVYLYRVWSPSESVGGRMVLIK